MPTCNILIIEDQYKEKALLLNALQEQGYNVEYAIDTSKAIEKIKQDVFDVVISEFQSAQINGLEIVQNVTLLSNSPPVILIAGDCSPQSAVEAMKMGAFDFFVKPIAPGILESSIANALETRSETASRPISKTSKYQIITENYHMKQTMSLAKTVADSKAPVLIQGESGTGKELFARYIHQHSSRNNQLLVALNCAALPDGLLESELFGHEKGAFTGAISRKLGKFELAHQGTILLDEISEMNLYLQAKLLRVLQESEIDRVGGQHPVSIDVRVIATTNREIEATIKEKKFRADLYYRLNVIPLKVLPLRERKDDIPVLAKYFIKKYNQIDNRTVKSISDEALATLMAMAWPGNVRELENVIERAVLLCDGDTIEPNNLFIGESHKVPQHLTSSLQPMEGTLREMERKMIFNTLDKTNGNRTHAADILGISVRTLRNKLNEYKQANITQ